MWQEHPNISSTYRESIKTLEADIQHANSLAAALPKDDYGDCIQMRLCYSPFASLFMCLIEWLDYTCIDTVTSYLGLLHIVIYKVYVDGIATLSSQHRRASLKEFYAVIYPSLRQLEGDLTAMEGDKKRSVFTNELSTDRLCNDEESSRDEDECNICMETCTKMVLPDCGHSMCIACFHDWNARSETCPYCRANLEGLSSIDLWILTSSDDVVDTSTLTKENLRCFYLYIENLPFVMPDDHTILTVYDYLI